MTPCASLLVMLALAPTSVEAPPATRLAPLLQAPTPRTGWCLRRIVSNRDVESIWKELRALDEEHERLFKAMALERAVLPVPVSEYEALYPYRYHCSKVEPGLYYSIEQLRRDADVLEEHLLGQPVLPVVAARKRGQLTKMPMPVERFFFVLLGSLDRIHAVNGIVARDAKPGWSAPWPARSLVGLSAREAVQLFEARLKALSEECRMIRAALEARHGGAK
jgi:hypothetical protein